MANPIPRAEILLAELDRCQRWLGTDASDWVAAAITHDWERAREFGIHQAAWASVSLTYRAARLRQAGRPALADILLACSEAAVLAWSDNVIVRAWVADLGDLPSTPDPTRRNTD